MTPAHKKGEHMTAIDLTSFVKDYETAETRAHKHALDIACIWSKLRTVVEQLSSQSPVGTLSLPAIDSLSLLED